MQKIIQLIHQPILKYNNITFAKCYCKYCKDEIFLDKCKAIVYHTFPTHNCTLSTINKCNNCSSLMCNNCIRLDLQWCMSCKTNKNITCANCNISNTYAWFILMCGKCGKQLCDGCLGVNAVFSCMILECKECKN